MYTLNREYASINILRALGLWSDGPAKSLPWRRTANPARCKEDVRPIFWALRPQSYVDRTSDWGEFPNGRWGNSAAASFGESNHYLFYLKNRESAEERLAMWGRELHSEQDVWDMMARYVTGEPSADGVKVARTPWTEGMMEPESSALIKDLTELNKRGVLTVNSQPRVNGLPSSHPVHGWGNPGGYVYQKAYLEFFTSQENIECLKQILPAYPQVNYHIVNNQGSNWTNCDAHQPVAVTWGVFRGKEIIQPTVVDPEAFQVWKEEAFSLWHDQWGSLYEEGSTSRGVIEHIINNYSLVNLVDNDFPLETCLFELVHKMLAARDGVVAGQAVDGSSTSPVHENGVCKN